MGSEGAVAEVHLPGEGGEGELEVFGVDAVDESVVDAVDAEVLGDEAEGVACDVLLGAGGDELFGEGALVAAGGEVVAFGEHPGEACVVAAGVL